VTRPSFSPADLEARAWLKKKILESGLIFRCDGAGNIFGGIGGAGKPVMAGSHIDTVPGGGMFDGSTGVLAALECLRTIKERRIPHARPLELAAFTDEEGNLVGDFLGSRAFVGLLDRELLEKGTTPSGRLFKDLLEGTEFTVEGFLEAHKTAPELEAYLELHIEQGPVLDARGVPIGIVSSIAGKRYRWCSFLGKAGHSGTTPFEERRDTFLGLAEFALESSRLIAAHYPGAKANIGQIRVTPGAFSVVPGRVDFSFEFRSQSAETLEALENEMSALANDIAVRRALSFSSRIVDRTTPLAVSPRLTGLLEAEAAALGYPSILLPSGAGHDAQILGEKSDAAMIFIPSPGGLSHSPQESVRWEDLEKGANLLLHALVRLAEK